jgi:hypothetical protein
MRSWWTKVYNFKWSCANLVPAPAIHFRVPTPKFTSPIETLACAAVYLFNSTIGTVSIVHKQLSIPMMPQNSSNCPNFLPINTVETILFDEVLRRKSAQTCIPFALATTDAALHTHASQHGSVSDRQSNTDSQSPASIHRSSGNRLVFGSHRLPR